MTTEQSLAPAPAPAGTPTPPLSSEQLAHRLWVLDVAIVSLVLLFALLVVSFPVTNSDFFLHLASGRLLAEGRFPFGHDPFASTTEGVYWANHSWLYDLAVYGLYQLPGVGPAAIVVLKGLLVAVLAGVMLLTARRSGQSLWIPAACTALALLALSARLLMQPLCVSCLFLGLTLWLLNQPRRRWLLPPLFLLWVNLDEFFVLGPFAIALYLLGDVLQGWVPQLFAPTSPAPRERRSLLLVLAASLAACLVNPFTWRAFTLPWQLGLTSASVPLAGDCEFGSLLCSPLQTFSPYHPTNPNAAGLAYWPLLVLGLVSFALTRGAWVGWRLLTWLGFAVLGLISDRSVPFFAIVAGPITSLNFLGYAARRFGTRSLGEGNWARWAQGGRGLTVLAVVLLLVAAVPGWLQLQQARRRVGWGVVVEPSLHQAALQIRDWRQQGLLEPEGGLFNTSPDVAYYLAWFCPGEQSFFDLRLPLFPEVARDYVTAHNTLAGVPDPSDDSPREGRVPPAWRAVFRKWKVRYLVFHTADPRRGLAPAVLRRLLLNGDGWPGEWTLCHADGRTFVAGWTDREQEKGNPYARLQLDWEQKAFGPRAEQAPGQGPDRLPEARPWWEALYHAPAPRPLAADEAALHLARHDLMAPMWSFRNQWSCEAALGAAVVGAAPAPGGPVVNGWLPLARLDVAFLSLHRSSSAPPPQAMDRLAEAVLDRHIDAHDSGPADALFLTVRAARRGVLENPDDARSWWLLGRAYAQLGGHMRERQAAETLPHAALVRQAQTATALSRALQIDPDLEAAHGAMAELYERAVYLPRPWGAPQVAGPLLHVPNLERELHHRKEQLRCARRSGAQAGETAEVFASRLEELTQRVGRLEEQVRQRRDHFEVSNTERPVLVQVEDALQHGLGETALNVLLRADPQEWSDGRGRSPGAVRVVELLLSMGRPEEAEPLLLPQNRPVMGALPALGLGAWDWFRIQRAAAVGDYDEADGLLKEILTPGGKPAPEASAMLAQVVGHELLWDAPLAAGMPWQVVRQTPFLIGLPPNRDVFLAVGMQSAAERLQQETDVRALRGWLALEAGHPTEARAEFQQVFERCRPVRPGPDLPLRALPLARLCVEWMQAKSSHDAGPVLPPGGMPVRRR
jgi:hypothetical protein